MKTLFVLLQTTTDREFVSIALLVFALIIAYAVIIHDWPNFKRKQ